jgi:hypothetical protein
LKENNFHPKILYPAKLSFKIDRGIKVFPDKQKLKPYMTTKLLLLKILQGTLHTEDESKQNHKRMGSIKTTGEEKTNNQRVAFIGAQTQILKQKNTY